MKRSLLLIAAITAGTPQFSPAQQNPATRPASPSGLNDVATSTASLQFRSLQAVLLDARERREDWHKAAQQAADRIKDPKLQSQFNQRVSGLVPIVAKALIDHPQEDALVTVAVFRDMADKQRQAMIAVTFNGLGGQIGQGFFANVIAGMPKAPETDGIPKNLALDTEASSFLVFFLGKDQLLAGDIPHAIMGRSVVAMINRQRQADQSGTGAVAVTPNVTPRTPDVSLQQGLPNSDGVPPYTNYINPNAYPMVNDGYYYPPGVGIPIVILPGDSVSTPDSFARQRQRQMALEQRYQKNPYGITPQSGNFITPQSGNSITPQSGNSVTPQSGNNNKPQSGNSNSGGSGNAVNGGSGNHVNPPPGNRPSGPTQLPKAGEPGGPPANKNAPPQPPKGTPPPGAPGGPPADSGKK